MKTEESVLFTVKEIQQFLPHRPPFLLVDRILSMDVEKNLIIGEKNLTINEDFFRGHFPGAPIMPGVLMIEALAQCGTVLVHHRVQNDKLAVLLNITQAKFRTPARPGDVLRLSCEGIHVGASGGRVKGVATVNGKTAAQAEIGFAFMDKAQV